MQHIKLLQNEGYELGNERFALGALRNVVLELNDSGTAIDLSQRLVSQFDAPEDYKNLAELYNRIGDINSLNELLFAARTKGFIDEEGTWIEADRD